MIAAIIVMLLAIIPLMMTSEPVTKSAKMLDFSAFSIKERAETLLLMEQ